MRTSLSILGFVVTFYALNVSLDRQRVEKFRSFLVSLWVNISDESFVDSYNKITVLLFDFFTAFRYRLAILLVTVFCLLAILVPVRTFFQETSGNKTDSIVKDALLSNSLMIKELLDFQEEIGEFEKTDDGRVSNYCRFPKDYEYEQYTMHFNQLLLNSVLLEPAIRRYAKTHSAAMTNMASAGVALAILSISPVLILAFMSSTQITLLLSRIYLSTNLSIAAIFLTMLATAFVIPVFVLSLFCIIFVFIWHFAGFETLYLLSWTRINLQSLLMQSYSESVVWLNLIFDPAAIYLDALIKGDFSLPALAKFFELVIYAFINIYSLLGYSIAKVYESKIFSIDYLTTMINWTISVDIIFSLSLILSICSNKLISTSDSLRDYIANLIQYCAESPKGPFAVIAAGIVAVINMLIS